MRGCFGSQGTDLRGGCAIFSLGPGLASLPQDQWDEADQHRQQPREQSREEAGGGDQVRQQRVAPGDDLDALTPLRPALVIGVGAHAISWSSIMILPMSSASNRSCPYVYVSDCRPWSSAPVCAGLTVRFDTVGVSGALNSVLNPGP